MKILKKFELAVSHSASKSPDFVYNKLRFVRNLIDRVNIEFNFLLNRPFLLVYQQGRVASTSVFESLSLMGLPYVMFHVHYLNMTKINAKRKKISNGNRIDRNLILGKMLSNKIIKITSRPPTHKRWKIVTVVREPISLLLSTLFINAKTNFKEFYIDGMLDKELVLESIRKKFIEEDPLRWEICRWFEDELANSLNFDIYNKKIDNNKSYFILTEEKFDVLVLRFEDLGNAFKKGVSHFFDFKEEEVTLLRSNPHKDERAMEVYRFVCENLKLPETVCRELYSCWYVKTFYSPDMINKYVKKWSVN